MIFPYPIDSKLKQTVCWIPDFQDKHLPEFFKADELKARETQHRQYFETYRHIVFSSQAAADDFSHFYPEAKVKRHVVRFAVFEKISESKAFDAVREKYKLPTDYFYCPNQFWIHKNHRVVIKAVAILKKMGRNPVVVFSGKEHDPRAPTYTDDLKAQVIAAGMSHNIRFLGFIPRDEQMAIFKHAVCVLQPSLFEGWSTVIEDAKSVGKFVVASKIPANVEQMPQNAMFFSPHDEQELAQLLSGILDSPPKLIPSDYLVHQKAFAQSFLAVLNEVAAENDLVENGIGTRT
jgi:glycosyltransferase involved in cell wall biosynthesis